MVNSVNEGTGRQSLAVGRGQSYPSGKRCGVNASFLAGKLSHQRASSRAKAGPLSLHLEIKVLGRPPKQPGPSATRVSVTPGCCAFPLGNASLTAAAFWGLGSLARLSTPVGSANARPHA